VQRAVMELQRLEPAKRVAERVNGAQTLLEGEAAFDRAHHHGFACSSVCPVRAGSLDVAPDTAGTVQRNGFSRRVEARREQRLDAVREGVEAGRGGEAGRQAEREVGVADGAFGDEVRADETELAAVVEREERRPADFGTG